MVGSVIVDFDTAVSQEMQTPPNLSSSSTIPPLHLYFIILLQRVSSIIITLKISGFLRMMPSKIGVTDILYIVFFLVRCWKSSLAMSSVNKFRH